MSCSVRNQVSAIHEYLCQKPLVLASLPRSIRLTSLTFVAGLSRKETTQEQQHLSTDALAAKLGGERRMKITDQETEAQTQNDAVDVDT